MGTDLRKLIRLMLESDETVPTSRDFVSYDPFSHRQATIESVAKDVAEELELSNLRYLSRSKRLYGAYTFAAIDERNENVVLKIQPVNEIEGYKRAQQMISRLPNHVSRHMPVIYKIRTLDELGVPLPSDDFGNSENLGIIVMERLEQLPGNMFDLITEPATSSMQSLRSLISDHQAFGDMVDNVIEKNERTISSVISKSDRKVDKLQELERLRKMLKSIAFSPESVVGDESTMISVTDGLNDTVQEKVRLWCRALGITKPGAIQTLTKMLMSTVSTVLGRRAVPKEPTRTSPGALGRVKGIRELVRALEDLKRLNINPSDVHGNNIMLRPETGELVLADLGHFK